MVTSFEVGLLKPNPLFYERCLEEVGCQPSECVYVDDIPQYVEAASQMGISGVVYSSNTDIAAELREKGIPLSDTSEDA